MSVFLWTSPLFCVTIALPYSVMLQASCAHLVSGDTTHRPGARLVVAVSCLLTLLASSDLLLAFSPKLLQLMWITHQHNAHLVRCDGVTRLHLRA